MHDKTWRQALQKTRRSSLGRLAQLLGTTEINTAVWSELETMLIQADVGVQMTQQLLDAVRADCQASGETLGSQVREALATRILELMSLPRRSNPGLRVGTGVTLLVGVNGTGKTTCAAKLAHHYKLQGKSVMLAAADTYRAAAAEQLSSWGDRLEIEVISGPPGSDPGAVVHRACEAAIAVSVDHLIIDTSGRMHTAQNLMAELQKIVRVCAKGVEGAPHSSLLVLDAATGQNGLAQAQAFTQSVPLDGVILAKLDGSAKGGIVLAIQALMDLPVLYIGSGENIDDFLPFSARPYVDSLLAIN